MVLRSGRLPPKCTERGGFLSHLWRVRDLISESLNTPKIPLCVYTNDMAMRLALRTGEFTRLIVIRSYSNHNKSIYHKLLATVPVCTVATLPRSFRVLLTHLFALAGLERSSVPSCT